MFWIGFWTTITGIGVLGLVIGANSVRFARHVAAEARALWRLRGDSGPARRFDERRLPAPVRRYLAAALADRRAPILRVRLTHSGTFRLGAGRPWLPIRGTQYFASDPPGFVWWGRVRLAPGVWIDARDESLGGIGGMLVKAESSLTIADARGPAIDQGALLRLLGEMVWLPTVLADERYVTWTAVDELRAEVALRVMGREVRALFEFGSDGLPVRFTAQRYRDVGGGHAELTPFVGQIRDYRAVDGTLVPFEMEGAWRLHDELFTYARFTVNSLALDPEIE